MPTGLTGCPTVPQTLQQTLVIACDENGNPDPNAEAVDAVASYDTESLLPLITNVWTGSSSYSKRDILDYHLSSTEDYYVYKVSTIGTYSYLKEVE